jgi:hypothetical protein
MHIEPLITAIQAQLRGQGDLGSSDPAVDAAIGQLVELIGPALRQAAFEIAEQAAGELRAQLADRIVDVVLQDGDPMLRVGDAPSGPGPAVDEDLDARITLRLPPSLKRNIEEIAVSAGDSVNTWVVEQLARRTRASSSRHGFRSSVSFDL